jgi:hypothetical protein
MVLITAKSIVVQDETFATNNIKHFQATLLTGVCNLNNAKVHVDVLSLYN